MWRGVDLVDQPQLAGDIEADDTDAEPDEGLQDPLDDRREGRDHDLEHLVRICRLDQRQAGQSEQARHPG